MIGGLVASLIVFAVGAILDFAVTASQYQHGFNIRTVGVILMIVGAIAGGYGGAHFAQKIDARWTRAAVISVGAGMTTYFFWRY